LWYNRGDAVATFERFKQVPMGIAVANSACEFDNSVAWMGADKSGKRFIVRAGANYIPEIISTPQVAEYFSTIDNLDGRSVANSMSFKGHEFYIIREPINGGTALAYDAMTKEWHFNSILAPFQANIISALWSEGGTYLFGSPGNEYIRKLNVDAPVFTARTANTATEVSISRTIVTATIVAPNRAKTRISELEIDISGPSGSIGVSWSKDGGANFNSARLFSTTPHKIRKLGWADSWTFLIGFSGETHIKQAWARFAGEPFLNTNPGNAK